MRDPESIHDEEWRIGWKSGDDALRNEGRFQLISDLVSQLDPTSIFDLCCGNGYQAELIKSVMPRITINGCDISSAAIKRASTRMDNCYTWNIDNSNLPEDSETYDLVLCIAALEHLYDVKHALKEIHRILKPGKHALIHVPNISFWRFRLDILTGKIPYILLDERHLHCFNKHFLIENLAQAGFADFHIYGQRQRIKWLATLWPSLFSETIFTLSRKQDK
jgi:SAM-dependent methyltransferase